jgi:3-isopropylmalate/(R)-2-methylmalate dehydratase small subunit
LEKFTRLTATACPLELSNVDTDQLLPARYLKLSRSEGLGKVLFHDLRRDAKGNERGDFPLNQAAWRESGMLIGGANFGVGSSREAAVYALYDYGIHCVIATSFGDIFAQNSVKNGLLPATVSAADLAELTDMLKRNPDFNVTVDLEAQTIACGNASFSFSIAPSWREQLLNGWDEIDLTRSFQSQIERFWQQRRDAEQWVVPQVVPKP